MPHTINFFVRPEGGVIGPSRLDNIHFGETAWNPLRGQPYLFKVQALIGTLDIAASKLHPSR